MPAPLAGSRRSSPRLRLPELALLIRRQEVLQANHQADLTALDVALEREDAIERLEHLRLVRRGRREERLQSLEGILQLPLQFGEPRLDLEDLGADVRFLRVGQADRGLARQDEVGREQGVAERVRRNGAL